MKSIPLKVIADAAAALEAVSAFDSVGYSSNAPHRLPDELWKQVHAAAVALITHVDKLLAGQQVPVSDDDEATVLHLIGGTAA